LARVVARDQVFRIVRIPEEAAPPGAPSHTWRPTRVRAGEYQRIGAILGLRRNHRKRACPGTGNAANVRVQKPFQKPFSETIAWERGERACPETIALPQKPLPQEPLQKPGANVRDQDHTGSQELGAPGSPTGSPRLFAAAVLILHGPQRFDLGLRPQQAPTRSAVVEPAFELGAGGIAQPAVDGPSHQQPDDAEER